MAEFEYLRPQSLEQALELLGRGHPMGGGTALTPRRRQLQAVLDLQDLGLDGQRLRDGRMALGGGVRLQAMLEGIAQLPPALLQACQLEVGWNLRNQATLAGCVVSSDGRSTLLVTLLALQASLQLEPGARWISLEQFLAERQESAQGRLIRWIEIATASELRYAGVARSPADRPIVCAAVARAAGNGWQVALGGHGAYPVRVAAAERALDRGGDWQASLRGAQAAASAAYVDAGDEWASAEYRRAVAGVLVRRLAQEIGQQ